MVLKSYFSQKNYKNCQDSHLRVAPACSVRHLTETILNKHILTLVQALPPKNEQKNAPGLIYVSFFGMTTEF